MRSITIQIEKECSNINKLDDGTWMISQKGLFRKVDNNLIFQSICVR